MARGPIWTDMETKVLREWIARDSKRRPLGSVVTCCKCCYDRNCVCSMYICCGMSAAVTFGVFIAFCVMIIHPYNYAKSFEPATCQTSTARFTGGTVECKCESSHFCDRRHKCFLVTVTMTTPEGMRVEAELFNDLDALQWKQEHCSYRARCAPSSTLKYKLSRYAEQFSNNGTKFECLYNRDSPQEVVLHMKKSMINSHVVLHVTVWPLVIIFVAMMSILLAYCICGCKPHVLPAKPSPSLRAEARRRELERSSSFSREVQAQREAEIYRRFYEQQGMPVPPPTPEGSLLHSPSDFQAILDKTNTTNDSSSFIEDSLKP